MEDLGWHEAVASPWLWIGLVFVVLLLAPILVRLTATDLDDRLLAHLQHVVEQHHQKVISQIEAFLPEEMSSVKQEEQEDEPIPSHCHRKQK